MRRTRTSCLWYVDGARSAGDQLSLHNANEIEDSGLDRSCMKPSARSRQRGESKSKQFFWHVSARTPIAVERSLVDQTELSVYRRRDREREMLWEPVKSVIEWVDGESW